MYSRVDSFWSSLFREFKYESCLENFVIVRTCWECREVLHFLCDTPPGHV